MYFKLKVKRIPHLLIQALFPIPNAFKLDMEGNDVEDWLEDMFAKVGGMWSDLRQADTVNYVESRVQSIGTDVKSFCSKFIQEVFSSSPAQTTTDPIDDIPLIQITETVRRISLTEAVSNEIPSVEIPGNFFEERISVKEEMSGSVDDPDVIVPASLGYLSCQSTLTEYLGEDDLVLPVCQPETSTSDLEDAKISTSYSESWNKECLDAMNHFAPGDCENEECLDAKNRCACGTGHPVLKEIPITNITDAASSSELVDVSAWNSELREWEYTVSGSSEEVIECETMLGESCIMIDTCPDKHQSMKQRAYLKRLQRKPSLRVAMVKDQDSMPADESSGSGHSIWQLEMLLPLAPEFKRIEQDWEIV